MKSYPSISHIIRILLLALITVFLFGAPTNAGIVDWPFGTCYGQIVEDLERENAGFDQDYNTQDGQSLIIYVEKRLGRDAEVTLHFTPYSGLLFRADLVWTIDSYDTRARFRGKLHEVLSLKYRKKKWICKSPDYRWCEEQRKFHERTISCNQEWASGTLLIKSSLCYGPRPDNIELYYYGTEFLSLYWKERKERALDLNKDDI